MNMTRPVLTLMNSSDSECHTSVCLYLPTAHQRNPPEPKEEDEIYIAKPIQGSFYSMVVGPIRDRDNLKNMVTSFRGYMDDSQQYGVSYGKEKYAVLNYGLDDSSNAEIVFFKEAE
ncbi:uncharacterized protein [Branchiostoma lanceolatum]|uniref:uncharacterized protein n=1 Tax=Branchiostoma lanceolatum TaxID=7740 RepID=UPI0034545190